MLVTPASIDFVVDVVNAWAPTARTAAEDTTPYPDLADLCEHHGVKDHRVVSDAKIAALADEIHAVFATSTASVALLATLVKRLDAKVAFDAAGTRWLVPPDQWLSATVLAGLVEYARTDPQLKRLDTCAAHRCLDAYVDVTQAATKRYCSNTCQTRAKAAARRSRGAEQSASP